MLTHLSAEELEDMLLLAPRVFSDYRDPSLGPFEMVYHFSQTADNADSGLSKIADLVHAGAVAKIGICEGSTANGYAGREHSVQRLMHFGLNHPDCPTTTIVPIKVDGNVNTRSEAEALVPYIFSAQGDVAIVAPPFHLMRAFTATVSAMFQLKKLGSVYVIAGAPLPWTQTVTHSQGTLKGTRAQILGAELERLERYRAPEYGSMLTARQMMKYLDWRDDL